MLMTQTRLWMRIIHTDFESKRSTELKSEIEKWFWVINEIPFYLKPSLHKTLWDKNNRSWFFSSHLIPLTDGHRGDMMDGRPAKSVFCQSDQDRAVHSSPLFYAVHAALCLLSWLCPRPPSKVLCKTVLGGLLWRVMCPEHVCFLL